MPTRWADSGWRVPGKYAAGWKPPQTGWRSGWRELLSIVILDAEEVQQLAQDVAAWRRWNHRQNPSISERSAVIMYATGRTSVAHVVSVVLTSSGKARSLQSSILCVLPLWVSGTIDQMMPTSVDISGGCAVLMNFTQCVCEHRKSSALKQSDWSLPSPTFTRGRC